ncbi:GspE/PulE family protein [Marinobacter persicus]|uniref:MSHA biogenesis protein MshE n=1 Tax=Marinobacter persicus TaxID=930118 RepID=A0A2S6G4K7_9GAMM|nr:GspE/PulE family protein [Marinobacter persicus]PPK51817.1 MSHA biogenesis protein MshE [Marinobacter persicus]PPK53929.1 MSHA biogenesis protein MshE [Marinobacter persicus]PPK58748.1 MSHA biogenesis protein MshE [Marinobacter persicus]
MSAEPKKKIRIGDLLVQNDVITEDQLKTALREQKNTGRKLGRTLVELGYVEEDTLLNILSRQLNVPFVQLRHYQFNNELVKKLPEAMARRFRAIVLAEQNGELLVGMADPLDLVGYDELVRVLKQPVKQAVVRESELLNTLDLVYRRTDEIASLAEELEDELDDDAFDLANLSAETESADAPVVKLLQTLFEDAVQARSSDIHIEPDETVVRIRQRIDGVLQEQVMKEKRVNSALVLRLKLMAGLNISEKRLPQDGRFNIRVKGRSIDVRVSTMPVQHGESVVMRLLDQSQGTLNLESTGMPSHLLERFRKLIKRPHGMILVTGPTGSGKTTTLYGALTELNKPEVKIITAEDPVEYRLPRITQVQVNPKIGLEFASVLRSALRQDPDIILVGEMRDHETVEIGLRAAMTGHLVLSTLHTNDSISSAMRLIDMGAEPFLVASSLLGVVAQRLVRRVCDNCTETYEPTEQELIWLRSFDLDPLDIEAGFVHGRGCYQCSNTGYRGRVGVYEMLEMNEDMLDALRRKDVSDFTRAARKSEFFRPLGQCAMDYALQGVTSLQEVSRVAATAEMGVSLEEDELSRDAIGVDS